MLLYANIVVHIGIVSCPYFGTTSQSCDSDTSWQSLPGWTTSLNATFRRASIAYSRLNGTILTHRFTEEPERAAPISSVDILQAWDNFLGVGNVADSSTQNILSMLGLGGGGLLFPGLVSWFLNGISAVSLENPAADTRGVNALQSLLAIPLYWCQTGMAERNSMVSLPSGDLLANTGALNITDDVRRSSKISLAVHRNEIAVSTATLTAYVSLSAFALILCFMVLCIGMCARNVKSIPKTSSFAVLDFCTNCVVTDTSGIVTTRGPFQAIKSQEGIAEKRLMNQMYVELAREEDQTQMDGYFDAVHGQAMIQTSYHETPLH